MNENAEYVKKDEKQQILVLIDAGDVSHVSTTFNKNICPEREQLIAAFFWKYL